VQATKVSILAILLSVFQNFSTAAAAKEALPSHDLMKFIIAHLNVTSFPSSIGPRRTTDKTSFADYGFFPVVMVSNTAVLEAREHDWKFEIRVLSRSANSITICLHDKAMNGGTYDAQQTLKLRPADRSSELVAEHNEGDIRCPEFTN
jgi:hypothetical protein